MSGARTTVRHGSLLGGEREADASLRMAPSFVSDATLGNQSPARPKAQGLQVHKNCSPPPNLPMTT